MYDTTQDCFVATVGSRVPSHLKRDQRAAGFENREQKVKAMYLVRHHRCRPAFAEIGAKTKGYCVKTLCDVLTCELSFVRCSNQSVLTPPLLPRLDKEGVVVQTQRAPGTVSPNRPLRFLRRGPRKSSIRDVRRGCQFHRRHCCRSLCAGHRDRVWWPFGVISPFTATAAKS
jgi:hypothetical protein